MKLLFSVLVVVSLGLSADAKADYWRSPNPSRVVVIGERDLELHGLLSTAFHEVMFLSVEALAYNLESPPSWRAAIVVSDREHADASSVYLDDPSSGVILRQGSAVSILDAVELRLAEQAGNLALVQRRLDSLGAANVRRLVDIWEFGKDPITGTHLVFTRSDKPGFLVVGLGKPQQFELRLKGNKLERIPNLESEPSEPFRLVIATPEYFDAAVAKFGADVPVMQVESLYPRLRVFYDARAHLAEWAGDAAKAKMLRARRDGFDFDNLDAYLKNPVEVIEQESEPIASTPVAAAFPPASDSTQETCAVASWCSAVLLSVLGWFLTFFALRRFPLRDSWISVLDAWSVPQLVAVGAFVAAGTAIPALGILGGVAVAVTSSVRK